jgi:hypothetical protein
MSFLFRAIGLFAFCALALAVLAQDQNLADIRRKADAGDANAQFHMAQAYLLGNNVAKDPAQGLAWLRKSADQGYFGAEYALAYMYLNGAEKLPKDQHEAAKWFRKAAVQQNKASQDKLAAMLAQGLISPEEANWRTAEAANSQPISQPTNSQSASHLPHQPKPVAGKAMPFSFADVETGLNGGITSQRMTTLVQEFGVDFKLSPVTRKRLSDEGADDQLLAALTSSNQR